MFKSFAALFGLCLAPLCLSACSPAAAPQPAEIASPATLPAAEAAAAPEAPATPRVWFICDALDQPNILVGWPANAAGETLVELYSKSGEPKREVSVRLGSTEGAAGSTFRNMTRAGRDAGYVRTFNPGNLSEPTAAYTPTITTVRLDTQDYACRWLARTRFMGFTTRRSVVITQDGDGDLLYQTFDFATAATAHPVELDGAQRSTVFSVEVRNGDETEAANGAAYAFENAGYRYEISAPANGEAVLRVLRNGRELLREPFLAFQTGPQ